MPDHPMPGYTLVCDCGGILLVPVPVPPTVAPVIVWVADMSSPLLRMDVGCPVTDFVSFSLVLLPFPRRR